MRPFVQWLQWLDESPSALLLLKNTTDTSLRASCQSPAFRPFTGRTRLSQPASNRIQSGGSMSSLLPEPRQRTLQTSQKPGHGGNASDFGPPAQPVEED